MAETTNSFSTIISDFVRLQNNSLDIIQKLNDATISSAEAVNIKVKDNEGNETTYTIPSFGYLKSSIDRLDTTIQKMMGLDGSDAFVRQADGTYKRIFQAKTVIDPIPIGTVAVPAKFITDTNWFFESLMTPSLKVSIDVTQYIPQQESKISVKRIILNADDENKINYFDTNLRGRNDIDYTRLIVDLQRNGIQYFIDEDILDLPLSVVRYSGEFIIVNYEDREITNTDGTINKKRYYLLNTLNYTDNLTYTKNGKTLAIGDKILNKETLYELVGIDVSTNYIQLKRLDGYEALSPGETVSLFSNTFSPKLANVGIGFSERQVIFFKSINDEENIISTKWSPGIGFFTNTLTIDTPTGSKDLKTFYQEEVLDFGNMLISGAKEQPIPAVDGLVPDPPFLDLTNFKVLLVNDHKLDETDVTNIRKKSADKIQLQSEITQLEVSINKKREELNTRKFQNDTERRGVKNELDTLIREKSSKSSLYASIVKELAVLADSKPASLDTPKYRIRGFFPLPSPKISDKNGAQEVIQFYIYYRYLRPDGSATQSNTLEFTDSQGAIKRGTDGNLIEIRTDIRKKIYDPITNKYVWAQEDIENPDVVNINQIDIPISKGEKVEFYIKSISEAGWPTNPILSEKSNSITVEFPQDLVSEDEASIALKNAQKEEILVQFQENLNAKGLDEHLSSSFSTGERYYAHDSESISSSFYTPEGKVISLFEKLKSLEDSIQKIQNTIDKVNGVMRIYIVDNDTKSKIEVQNNATVNLFAGFYKDDYVDILPPAAQKGAIINKIYQLYVENDSATALELISRFPGGLSEDLPTSNPLSTSSTDYDTGRRYDKVSVVNNSIESNDTNNANKISTSFHQSGQLRSQFEYTRLKDVGLGDFFYKNPVLLPSTDPIDEVLSLGLPKDYPTNFGGGNKWIVPDFSITGGTTQTFVWNSTFGAGPTYTPSGGGQETRFCIHVDHPIIQNITQTIPGFTGAAPLGWSTIFEYLQLPPINLNIDDTPQSPEATSAFRHSKFFNRTSNELYGKIQLAYSKNWPGASVFNYATNPSVNPTNYPVYSLASNGYQYLPDKCGFTNNDRYLIGDLTCGNYLFLAPSTFDQLLVDGTNALADKKVEKGTENAIIIPIIYQFRMTDYYGSSSTGTGIVGGFNPATVPPNQIKYRKNIGIDIYRRDETVFSFDVSVSSAYKRTSLAQRTDTIQTSLVKTRENITYDKTTVKNLKS